MTWRMGVPNGADATMGVSAVSGADASITTPRPINAFFIQGNAHALVVLAKNEKDPELKKQIISKLALTGSKEAADYLMEFLKE